MILYYLLKSLFFDNLKDVDNLNNLLEVLGMIKELVSGITVTLCWVSFKSKHIADAKQYFDLLQYVA
jgi:hypothetical protein